ncbi:MAG: secE [Candidatus Saccharibacteria bacterium]|nr:secE [Candidatus Saccharibacteria bacterium]
MATKAKKPAAKQATSQTKVTRITARDTEKVAAKKAPAKAEKPSVVKEKKQSNKKNPIKSIAAPFVALGIYFKGAWYELQQVTWPNRKATWSLTAALLAFTLFFVVLILLLDALFKYLFELILG